MSNARWWLLLASLPVLACPAPNPSTDDAGNGPTLKVDLHGAVQKGPFVIGSSIEVSLLDAALAPTGAVFNTQTTNDRGEFDIAFEASGPVALQGVGYYYNEVIGGLSQSNLTLRAFYVPAAAGAQAAFVNIVTQLTTERIKALVSDGSPFTDAVARAEGELLHQLAITYPGFAPGVRGIDMNVAGGDNDNNAYLLAVSTVLTQVAINRGGTSIDANVQELLNSMSIDLADGSLGGDLGGQIATALLQLDVAQVATALAARLTQIGSTETPPDMNRVLDQDRDGIVNQGDNCPRHHNPQQENADGDGFGNVCDDCPGTACADRCVPASVAAGRPDDICYTACRSDADCAGELCVTAPLGDGGPEGTLGLCAAACDPLAPACGADLACFWLAGGEGAQGNFRWACLPPEFHGAAAAGASCLNDNQICGSGLSCGVQPDFPFFACRAICDPTNPTTCDSRPCVNVVSQTGQTPTGIGLCALPPGAAGDPCSPQDASTCADGLRCVREDVSQLGFDACVEAGAAGQPCLPGNTCDDATLVCAQQGAGCAMGGGWPEQRCCVVGRVLNESCDTWGQPCIAGLACATNPSLCPDNAPSCCIAPIAEGGECYNMQVCAAGLACASAHSASCPGDQASCCVQAGDERQPCNPLDNSCDSAGLACLGGVCYLSSSLCSDGTCADASQVCVQGVCIQWGGDKQPCGPGRTCLEGFGCTSMGHEYGCSQFLMECCIPIGGEGESCLADGTCNDATLVCHESWSRCPIAGAATYTCCLPGAAEGALCDQDHPCLAGLGCAPAGTCDDVAGQCCVPLRGADEECYFSPICEGDLVCAGATLGLCATGLASCCTTAGAAGEPCNPGNTCDSAGLACVGGACRVTTGACGVSNSCSAGYRCVNQFCIETGDAYQPCNLGDTCDAAELRCVPGGAACGNNPEVNACCLPWGGAFEVCGSNRECDSSELICTTAPSGTCLGGTTNECCRPWGGDGQPCGSGGACHAGLGCVNTMHDAGACPTGMYQCCGDTGAEGELCHSDGTCDDATLVCTRNTSNVCSGLMMDQFCCLRGAALGATCDASHPCLDGLGCATTGSCAGGGACCIATPGVDENCYSAQICASGLVCAGTSVVGCPAGLSSCCASAGGPGEPCHLDLSCDDSALVCLGGLCRATSGTCSTTCSAPGEVCISGHCIESGAASQPCNSGGTCDSVDLLCKNDAMVCGATFGSCCLPFGGAFEICGNGDTCDPGLVCASAYGVCPGGGNRCCVPAGGVGEACRGDRSCDTSELLCATNSTYPCSWSLGECCQPWGASGQLCGPGDACDVDLGCVYATANPGLCSGSLSRCCGPAGALGQVCTSDGSCDDSTLVCTTNNSGSCPGLMPHERCCVLGQALGAPCDLSHPCQGGLACAATGACAGGASSCCIEQPGLGDNCYGAQICEAGLACASSALVACAGGVSSCCAEAGALDQPCNADGSCDGGMACIGGVCHATIGPCGIASSCASGYTCISNYCLEAGGADQPCNAGNTCDAAALECLFNAGNTLCRPGLTQCCLPTGVQGQLCRTDNSCSSVDLSCVFSSTYCPGGLPNCCMPTGGADEPCGPGNSCDTTDLVCAGIPPWTCPAGLGMCCLEAGGLGQPCLASNLCDDNALACYVGPSCPNSGLCCEQAGAAGQPCNADDTCDLPDLACVTTSSSCPQATTDCCLQAGDLNQPCLPGGTCDDPYTCTTSPSCPNALVSCCLP